MATTFLIHHMESLSRGQFSGMNVRVDLPVNDLLFELIALYFPLASTSELSKTVVIGRTSGVQ
ncbi:MAG: hypothetical protein OXC02_08940 [Rhodobacteraceae bacterium]|nr:hypothetical protein [Paracoccaceae bacterium]